MRVDRITGWDPLSPSALGPYSDYFIDSILHLFPICASSPSLHLSIFLFIQLCFTFLLFMPMSPETQNSNEAKHAPEPSEPEPIYVSTAKPRPPLTPEEIENSKKPKVMIVGAGLGGLTLAILLHKANIPFDVYERAKEVKPLGKIAKCVLSCFCLFSLCVSMADSSPTPIQMCRVCHVSRLQRCWFLRAVGNLRGIHEARQTFKHHAALQGRPYPKFYPGLLCSKDLVSRTESIQRHNISLSLLFLNPPLSHLHICKIAQALAATLLPVQTFMTSCCARSPKRESIWAKRLCRSCRTNWES